MHSVAEYIMDRAGLFTWTEKDLSRSIRETEMLVNLVIQTCAELGAKTGTA